MTADRALTSRALAVAGCASERKVHAAGVQALLTALVREIERLGAEIAHLRGQLAGMSRPAGMTAAERACVRWLHRELERAEFRLELASDEPVRYALTPKAEAEAGELEAGL